MKNHRIPLLHPTLPELVDIADKIVGIDKRGWYTNFGPLSLEFETRVREYLAPNGVASVVCTSNGTTALEIALSALSLPANSKILVPSFTFAASATAIIRAGHIPVFGDIDRDKLSMTPFIAEAALRKCKFDAVVSVAPFGQNADLSDWAAFQARHKLPVIVDAAAGFGNFFDSFPVVTTFSFHATKSFSTCEGGAIVAENSDFIDQCRDLTNFGLAKGGAKFLFGTNAKLSEYHAAIGLAQFEVIDKIFAKRRKLASQYFDFLGNLSYLKLPFERNSIYSSFPVILQNTDVDAFGNALTDVGIETRRWYYPPLHKHPAFSQFSHATNLNVTEEVGRKLIGLPFHLKLNSTTIQYIYTKIDLIEKALSQYPLPTLRRAVGPGY